MARGIYGVRQQDLREDESAQQVLVTRSQRRVQTEVTLRLELFDSQACWYELLFNDAYENAKNTVVQKLRLLQEKAGSVPLNVQDGTGVCSVGFWCARTKVRFCMSKSPRFALLNDEFIFYIEFGKARIRKKMSTTFVDVQTGSTVRPHIEVNACFITISLPNEEPETVSIYEFLRKCGLELGISTDIHAVACMPSPVNNWLACADRRLTHMLYSVSNEEHDFFLFCNLFKVKVLQMASQTKNAAVTGCAVWEISEHMTESSSENLQNLQNWQLQTYLIEKAFHTYFQLDAPSSLDLQTQQMLNEALLYEPMYSIQVLMDMDQPHELYSFGSAEVEAQDQHMFSCQIKAGEVELSVLN